MPLLSTRCDYYRLANLNEHLSDINTKLNQHQDNMSNHINILKEDVIIIEIFHLLLLLLVVAIK